MLRWCLCLGLSLGAVIAGSAQAQFVVKDVRTSLDDNRLLVTARIDLALNEEAERAVDAGVPLTMLTEFTLFRRGAFWDHTVSHNAARIRLRYHALSSQYVVESDDAEQFNTFRSVAEALRRMGTLQAVRLELPAGGAADLDRYRLAVRSRLDINALPAPLRTLAFFSTDWQLSSDWTQWRIAP